MPKIIVVITESNLDLEGKIQTDIIDVIYGFKDDEGALKWIDYIKPTLRTTLHYHIMQALHFTSLEDSRVWRFAFKVHLYNENKNYIKTIWIPESGNRDEILKHHEARYIFTTPESVKCNYCDPMGQEDKPR